VTGETLELTTARLVLEPLRIDHAVEMVPVLGEENLYRFTGGLPPTLEQLTERYQFQVAGIRAGIEEWFNWILRLGRDGPVVGFVQATVIGSTADVAWVVGAKWQGKGLAREAGSEMISWFRDQGVSSFTAHIHTEHRASQGVASSLGFVNTGELDDDGEEIWQLFVTVGES
jgi:RimJ/RimL family protein N-acetyltransferase